MKIFIDTEFLEGTQKEKFPISLFRKQTPNTIDLISIGLVAEDGREYYAVSKDFNLEEAWNRFDIADQTPYEKQNGFLGRKIYWIRENVLKPIWIDLFLSYESEYTFLKGKSYDFLEKELKIGIHDKLFTFKSFKALISRYGKSNKQISREIQDFSLIGSAYSSMDKRGDILYFNSLDEKTKQFIENRNLIHVFSEKPEFYAYYADYDWVVFCWLFGKMMDLPSGFPMYCKDLKQMLDDKYPEPKLTELKCNPFVGYPKQENEHSAISDARWNQKLFNFLNTI